MRRFISIFCRPCLNRHGLAIGVLFLIGGTITGSFEPVAAQTLPPQLQQLMNPREGMGAATSPSPFSQRDTPAENGTVLIQPAAGPSRPQPRSALEQILSARAGVLLNQFGYAELGGGRSVLLPQSGGIQDSYIMGPGDEVIVTLRGQEAGEYRTFVDRNGRVILPKLNPINVAGRTFSDFRLDLAAAVQRAYVATQAFASLGTIRQIRVTVGGEVNNPGPRLMTGLASALDAIQVSSGVKKTGSLRNIVIQRGGARIRVDLYGVLRGSGNAQIPLLTDGDRVIVSPLGPTVAIAGPVRVPGIYELAPGQPGMAAASLIAMAGGYTVRGRYDLVLIGLGSDGRTQMSNLPNDRTLVRDSDVLIVRATANQTVGRATLQAGTDNSFSGTYATQATRLSDMLRAPGMLGDDPYPLFAVISRRDPVSLLRTLVAVTPSAVMAGRQDFSLQSDDVVHTFTRTEAVNLIRAITWFDDRRRRTDQKIQNSGAVPLLGAPEETSPARQAIREDTPTRRGGAAGAAMAGSSRGDFVSDRTGSNSDMDYCRIPDAAARDGFGYDGGDAGNNRNAAAVGAFNDDLREMGANGDGAAMSSDLVDASQANVGNAIGAVGGDMSGVSAARDQLRVARPDPASVRYCRELGRVQRLADALKVEPEVVANFLQEHLVTLNGAVRGPGSYLVGPDLPLGTLVQAAGGTVNWSDRTGVERVSTVVDGTTGQARTTTQILDINQAQFATTIVRPSDRYRFPEAPVALMAGTVTLKGEVRRPGVYNIVRGERLSDLLVRAGGLTSVAYPYGAVFLRKSVAAREQEGFQQAARDLERQLTVSMARPASGATTSNAAIDYTALRALVNDFRNQQALGRVSVVADPAVLATRPQSDLLIESGDILFIPQRPTTITVLGEVMNSGNFRVEPRMTVTDYISLAGGYARFADDSRTYLVLPDGTARQIERSWFAMKGDSIPPGSTILVPKDLDPIDFRAILLQGTQIMSQLAISAASLAVLNRGN